MRQKSSPSYIVYNIAYWTGVVLAIACFCLVLAHETSLAPRIGLAGMPLSWVLGIAAILAFLVAEQIAPHEPPEEERWSAETSSAAETSPCKGVEERVSM